MEAISKSSKIEKITKLILITIVGTIAYYNICKSKNSFLSSSYDNANFCNFVNWNNLWGHKIGIATVSCFICLKELWVCQYLHHLQKKELV